MGTVHDILEAKGKQQALLSGLDRREIEAAAAYMADEDSGIVTQAWSPIGGITFYPRPGAEGRVNVMQDPVIAEIAAAHGKTPAQVMIRWHLQEGRSAIPKSVNPVRIAENFDVFDFQLSTQDLDRIDRLDRGVRNGPDPDLNREDLFSLAIPEA